MCGIFCWMHITFYFTHLHTLRTCKNNTVNQYRITTRGREQKAGFLTSWSAVFALPIKKRKGSVNLQIWPEKVIVVPLSAQVGQTSRQFSSKKDSHCLPV